MVMASIDIDAMDNLLSTMRTAGTEFQGRRSDLRNILFNQSLPTGSVGPLTTAAQWCSDQVPGLTRRLALAHLVQSQDVSMGGVVQIDESMLSDLTPAEAEALAQDLAETLNSGQPLSDEQLAILIENSADPYFAVALMNAVPPEQLAMEVERLSHQHEQDLANVFPEGDETFEEARNRVVSEYEARLEAFGVTLGTASRSVDPPLRSGYADEVVELMTQSTGNDGTVSLAPVAMSVILGYGSYGEDFAATVAEGLYEFERSEEFLSWRGVAGSGRHFTLPGGSLRTDVMPGVMTMLGTNPEAAQEFFSGGPTTTIEVDGHEVTVTERMKYLVTDRVWGHGDGSDEAAGLGSALEAATIYYRNREGTGETSAILATQLFSLIAGKTGEGADNGFLGTGLGADGGWEMYMGLRDSVADILADYAPDMFRVVGNPAVADDLTGGYFSGDDGFFPPGMPYGALFTPHVLEQIMGTLGQDPEHVTTVGAGWAAANSVMMNYQLQRIEEDPDAAAAYLLGQIQAPDNFAASGASVLDFLMDSAFEGDADDAALAEKRAQAMKDILSLATSIPVLKPAEMLGEWGGWAFGQAKSEALDAIGNSGSGASDTDSLNEIREEAAAQAQEQYLNALLAQGYFDESVIDQVNETPGVNLVPPPEGALTTDENGNVVFDTESAEFQQWALNNAPISAIQQSIIAAFGLEPRP